MADNKCAIDTNIHALDACNSSACSVSHTLSDKWLALPSINPFHSVYHPTSSDPRAQPVLPQTGPDPDGGLDVGTLDETCEEEQRRRDM
jgi:hypothetical protein